MPISFISCCVCLEFQNASMNNDTDPDMKSILWNIRRYSEKNAHGNSFNSLEFRE